MASPAVNLLTLVARILLAALFLWSGFGKIGGFTGTVGYIASKGLPLAQALAAATVLVEIGAGLLLLIGWKARWAALALAIFTVLAAVLFHNYWAVPEAQKMMQQISFMKNLAIIGGLLMVVAFGAGSWSVDRR
jgi:putative oxidoreductase